MFFSVLLLIHFFHVNISEVNYLTSRYIIDNTQAHFQFWITFKIIVCGEKLSKVGTILSRKSSKDPYWLAMCSQKHRVAGSLTLKSCCFAIQHKGDILPIRTCGDFFPCRVCIDTTMSVSTCRMVPWIFRQSMLAKSITALFFFK